MTKLLAVAVALAVLGCGGSEAAKTVLIDECSRECIRIDTCTDQKTMLSNGQTILFPSTQECFPGIGYALAYWDPATGQGETAACDAANTCTVLRVQTPTRACSTSGSRWGAVVEASCPW